MRQPFARQELATTGRPFTVALFRESNVVFDRADLLDVVLHEFDVAGELVAVHVEG